MKTCKKCGKNKPFKEFEKKTGTKMGVVCQSCKKETAKKLYEERKRDRQFFNSLI